jgi:hypothetical protein
VEAIASTFRPPLKLRDRVRRVTVAAPVVSTPLPAPPVAMLAAASAVSTAERAASVSRERALVNSDANSQTGSEKTPTVCKTVSKVYIQFLADEVFMAKYRKASALLSNRLAKMSFEAVFGELLDEFIQRHDPQERHARRERRVRRVVG